MTHPDWNIQPIDGLDMQLSNLARLYVLSDGKLGTAHRLMAVSAAAAATAEVYGPTVRSFQVSAPDLPETVKGVIASYMT